jgi:hypothetical protein
MWLNGRNPNLSRARARATLQRPAVAKARDTISHDLEALA